MNDTWATQAQALDRQLADAGKRTREYAKFSRDARGLGHGLGALLVFLAIFLLPGGPLSGDPLGIGKRILLCALPVVWIAGKQWLQERYYQFSGSVSQPKSRLALAVLALLTAVVAIVSLIVSAVLTYRLARNFSLALTLSTAISVAWLLIIPFLVWKHLRAPYEFMMGIFLLSLPALALDGPLFAASRIVTGSLTIFASLVAFIALFVGYSEHMKFLKLRRKMTEPVNFA